MIGRVISHYRILDKIGQGGMGVVYKARDLTLGRFVALKFLHPHIAGQQTELLRFEREAKAAASLNHPNICAIYEFVRDKDHTFIAMEYIGGKTLKEHIKQQGKLPVPVIVEYIKTIAGVLSLAHQKGIIHRDIKSDNIMLTPDGELKVMDFGLAKMLDAPTITVSEHPMGTVSYMSPEMVKAQKVDHRTDLWSLGVVFYEMLTGDLPFQSDTEVSTIYAILNHKPGSFTGHRVNVDRSVLYIITTLLEKDLRHRYQTAESLIYDLEHKVRASSTKLFFRKVRKNLRILSLLFLLLFVLLFVFVRFIQPQINKPPWLKSGAAPVRLTSDTGIERGYLSPNRDYITYAIGNKLYLKNLRTRQTNLIYQPENETVFLPKWAPGAGNRISFVSLYQNRLSILDPADLSRRDIFTFDKGDIIQYNWSLDGKKIAYITESYENGIVAIELSTVNSDGSENRSLLKFTDGPLIARAAWHPDGRVIAFHEFHRKTNKFYLRTIDTLSKEIKTIVEPAYQEYRWWQGGLTWSPDGRYLVYPEYDHNNVELIALPMNKNGVDKKGDPIKITRLSGMGTPIWPNFDRSGNTLCYSIHQRNWNIYTVPLDLKNKKITGEPVIKTLNKGYDYDAYWAPDGKSFVFVSDRDGQRDIFIRDMTSGRDIRVTDSRAIESKTRYVPGTQSISFLSNDKIWRVPITGGDKQLLFPPGGKNILVKQYAWGPDSCTLFAVISQNDSDRSKGQVVQHNILTHKTKTLLPFINLPDFCEIRYNPVLQVLALRSLDDDSTRRQVIQICDPVNNETWDLLYHSPILTPQSELAWTPDGTGLLYSTYFEQGKFKICLKEMNNNPPIFIKKFPGMEYVHGQISPDGTTVFAYASTWDSDIWMLGTADVNN